jgi:hypothetical protein
VEFCAFFIYSVHSYQGYTHVHIFSVEKETLNCSHFSLLLCLHVHWFILMKYMENLSKVSLRD